MKKILLRINDIELENELKNIFLDSISIKTEFVNLQPSLLSERYKDCLLANEDNYLQADQWRERSYYYSKTIFESDIPNAAFIPAIAMENLCAREDLHNAFISRSNKLDGFEFKNSEYKRRSLYVYHKDVILSANIMMI